MTDVEAAAASTAQQPALSEGTVLWNGFWALVWLSMRRQARARQMVLIALGLLTMTTIVVGLLSAERGWGINKSRAIPGLPPTFAAQAPACSVELLGLTPFVPLTVAPLSVALESGYLYHRERYAVLSFSDWIVFSIFLVFLLPLFTLSFATEALGGEREARTLLWVLTRPLPRPLVYLAQFLALLPWTLALNLGGFALLCLVSGEPGRIALRLFWPAILAASLAFAALFHVLAACFSRPAVLAIVYSFFLETFLGNMPGYLKRVSISFYTRCMMFDEARAFGLEPVRPSVYLPVDGTTALLVLIGVTIGLLVLGTVIFSRTEYGTAV